jgi:hypothetical protein
MDELARRHFFGKCQGIRLAFADSLLLRLLHPDLCPVFAGVSAADGL